MKNKQNKKKNRIPHHDGNMWSQGLGLHDEEDDLDEAQSCFDYLSGPRRQEQADVVKELLHGLHLYRVWSRRLTSLLQSKHQTPQWESLIFVT